MEKQSLLSNGQYRLSIEGGRTFYVDEEAIDQFFSFISLESRCKYCKNLFSDGFHEVAQSICRDCFQERVGERYKYIGPVTDGYGWLDTKEHKVHVTDPKNTKNAELSERATADESATLAYYHFSFPRKVFLNGTETYVNNHISWYGDIERDRFLLVRVKDKNYHLLAEKYLEEIVQWYAIERNGFYTEISFKKGDGLKWYKAARQKALAEYGSLENVYECMADVMNGRM